MSVNQNAELMIQLYEDVWNSGSLQVAETLIADNHVFHLPNGSTIKGLNGYKEFVTSTRIAFPDFQIVLDELFCSDDKVVNRTHFTGTHQGIFRKFKATGKKVLVGGQHIYRVENNKFVEAWGNFDEFGLLEQLGVISIK